MNIIIPKAHDVDYMVLDFRDALEGIEMSYQPGNQNDLSNWVVVVPKIMMVNEDGFTLDKYVKIKKRFAQYMNDDHLKNLKKSYNKGVKVITIPQKEKSVTVSAPLWKNSEQLITVLIKDPIIETGDTRKFLDVVDAGICSLDYTAERSDDYVPGNLISLKYAGFTNPSNVVSKEENESMER